MSTNSANQTKSGKLRYVHTPKPNRGFRAKYPVITPRIFREFKHKITQQ